MNTAPPAHPKDVTKSWIAGLGQVSAPPAESTETPEAPNPGAPSSTDAPKAAAAVQAPQSAAAAVAPKTEAPQTETKNENIPDNEDGEEKWPRTGQEWKAFKAKRKEEKIGAEKKIKELEAELTTMRAQPASQFDPKEFESVKAERDELSKRLQIIAVQQHPKFEAYFKNKTEAQINLAKNIVGADRAEAIEKILQMSDPEARNAAMEEVMLELTSSKQWQMGGVLNSLDQIRMEREQEIERAGQTYQEMQANQKKEMENRRTSLEKLFSEEVAKVQDKEKGLPMFQFKDGDDNWNNDVKERIEAAKNVLLGTHQRPETLVQVALNAMAYQPLLNALKYQATELGKLQKQITALTAANPVPGPGRVETEETVKPASTLKPNMRPMDATAAWTKGLPQVQGQR